MFDPVEAPEPVQLWTIDQVAHRLNVRSRTVHEYIKSRDLPTLKIGGSLRFKPSEVEAWIESQRKTG